MTIKTLFSIILKILGILFIKDILLGIPQILGVLTYSLSSDYAGGTFGTVSLILISLGLYGTIAYWLLFKPEWLIEKFKLDQGFDVDPIKLNMHRSSLLSICVIVIGALMFVNALPQFIQSAISYYKESQMYKYVATGNADIAPLVVFGLQIIIGLLLMGNQRQIVSYIELRRRNKIEMEQADSE